MPFALAERVADALLFDTILHPARDPFAVGALAPHAAGGRFSAEARALVTTSTTRLDVRVRLLHHASVVVEAVAGADLVDVPALDGAVAHDELTAAHHDLVLDTRALLDAGPRGVALPFTIEGTLSTSPIDIGGSVVGRSVRRHLELHGVVRASLVRVDERRARLVLRVENDTPYVAPGTLEQARQATMFAVHLVVDAPGGSLETDRGGDLSSTVLAADGRSLLLASPFAPKEMEANARVLVAGVGDIDFGDDAVGLAIAHRLVDEAALPRDVSVIEAGASAIDVVEHLGPRAELLVLVGAIARGGPPGTVYAVDAQMLDVSQADHKPSTPASILHALSDLATPLPKVVVVGVEPVAMASGMPLSQPVDDAIPNAISLILDVVGHAVRERDVELPDQASQV